MKNSMDLSIVIGTYKTRDLVNAAVNSIYKETKNIKFEIIVIDDASKDGTYQLLKKNFPQLTIIKNIKNLNYCKTYNKGTKIAKGRYILHINSDVFFTKKTKIDNLIKFMDRHSEIGILGNKVLKFNGKLDPPSRHQTPTLTNTIAQSLALYKIFPNIKKINYYMNYLNENEETEVGGVGAFMLFRREVWNTIGRLDEKFKLYCQDSDFCFRAHKYGWKLIYYPKSEVMHLGAGSVKRFNIKTQIMFHQDMWHYFNKHYSSLLFLLKYPLFLGLLTRFFAFMFIESFLVFKNKFNSKKNRKISYSYSGSYDKIK